MREQEPGFGVGQQLRTETGTRKRGVDARAMLTELWTARGEAFRQTNLATCADRALTSSAPRERRRDRERRHQARCRQPLSGKR